MAALNQVYDSTVIAAGLRAMSVKFQRLSAKSREWQVNIASRRPTEPIAPVRRTVKVETKVVSTGTPICVNRWQDAKAPHDKTLCEELGIVAWDTSDEYSAAIHEYIKNGHKNQNSYKVLVGKLGSIGKIASGAVKPVEVRIAPPKVLTQFANALRAAV